jgi:hypothetical protein
MDMNKLTSFLLNRQKWVFITLFAMLFTFFGCKKDKDKDDGILSGKVNYAIGFRVTEGSSITQAYCYVFIDDDTDITNGYIKRLIIDLMDVTAGTQTINYEINTSDVPAGTYYLLSAYDFAVDNDGNTDPEIPGYWEAKGWFSSSTTSAPASANVSDLSGEYDLNLYGLD